MADAPPYRDRDRLLGCLLGGAIGDALGAPVEGTSLAGIRAAHGPGGVAGFVPAGPGEPAGFFAGQGAEGRITGNTQLALITAQALIRSSVRARARGIGGATAGLMQSAYLAWLAGQDEPVPPRDGLRPGPGGILTARRTAGRSVLSALRKAAERQKPGHPLGTPDDPVNDSKGSAGAVRVAPCGFAARTAERAFDLGRVSAALTHGHPGAQLPAGVHAALVWGLMRDLPFGEALGRAREQLERHEGHEETSAALAAAAELAAQGPSTPERVESLGGGWTGEEAIAIAVYLMLRAEPDVPETAYRAGPSRLPAVGRNVLLHAVNHSGASASTGALTGSLLGARYGIAPFPGHWQVKLEVRRLVIEVAADCTLEFFGDPPALADGYGTPSPEWTVRYPEG